MVVHLASSQLRLRLAWAWPATTPSLGRLATCDGQKELPISARSERMPVRSDGDGGAVARCGDGEQRMPRHSWLLAAHVSNHGEHVYFFHDSFTICSAHQ